MKNLKAVTKIPLEKTRGEEIEDWLMENGFLEKISETQVRPKPITDELRIELEKKFPKEANQILSHFLQFHLNKSVDEIAANQSGKLKPMSNNILKQIMITASARVRNPQNIETSHAATNQSENSKQFKIEFNTFDGKIKLMGKKLAKPRFCSPNEKFFKYIYNKPNETILKQKLIKSIGKGHRDWHKRIENLGFTGILKDAFFQVSKDAILFRNPVTQADLIQEGISPLEFIKKLSLIES